MRSSRRAQYGRSRSGSTWQRFRRRILNARRWRCARCGRPGRLELHHVRSLADGGAELDPANVEVLCRTCHVEHHRADYDIPADRAAWREFMRGVV